MEKEEIKKRLQDYTVRIVKLQDELPDNKQNQLFMKYLIGSVAVIGAKFMAATNSKSSTDFINKAKVAEEKANECLYYLEIIKQLNPDHTAPIERLSEEAKDLMKTIEESYRSLTKKQIGFGLNK